MTTIGETTEVTAATSSPASEVAMPNRADGEAAAPSEGLSALARTGRLLRRGYERAWSAIFGSDDECMRL